MKLNFRLQNALSPTSALPIILIHGLFGNLDNLGVLARDLQKDHNVIQIDLRNHGLSPRSPQVNYPEMAKDVLELMVQLAIEKTIIIGHSMGGKVAMAMTALAPKKIEKLIAIDIAPVNYQVRRHDQIFAALNAVNTAGVTQRQEAAQLMRNFIKEQGVIQFLLKSFQNGEWRFNVPALWDQYDNIVGWQQVPVWFHPILFIRGELSPYIQDSYRQDIARQFPQAKMHVVAGTGHWVHAEKPDSVLRAIHRFIDAK
ncbi:MAG: esterase [Yersinia sp. (in: enterobacteria)]